METVIEQQRRCHEERERLENAMTAEMLLKKGSVKEEINSDHRVNILLDRYVEVTGMELSIFIQCIHELMAPK